MESAPERPSRQNSEFRRSWLSALSDRIRPVSQYSYSSDRVRIRLAGVSSQNSLLRFSDSSFGWVHRLRSKNGNEWRTSNATDEVRYGHGGEWRTSGMTDELRHGSMTFSDVSTDLTSEQNGHIPLPVVAKQRFLWATVTYGFHAERPDELDAKEGEALIILPRPQSLEWVVAQPIGRLGGPGLIPLSYIDIKDVMTGLSVDDMFKALDEAAIPSVKEWKRVTSNTRISYESLGVIPENPSNRVESEGSSVSTSGKNTASPWPYGDMPEEDLYNTTMA